MQKQSNFGIALLIFIAVFGITNIPNNYAAIGSESIFWFLILIFYFVPIALIMAELASYNKNTNSGISGWVEIGTTKKIAFICGWAYFIENIFYLPMLASRIPVFISWMFADYSSLEEVIQKQGNIPGIISATDDQILFLGLAFLTFIIAIVLSIYYEKIFDKMGKYIGGLSLIIAFGFIAMTLGSVWIFHNTPVNPLTIETMKPNLNPVTLSTIVWIIFAIGGVETIGSVVNNIDNSARKLPKIVVTGSVLVILAYTLGIVGLSFIISPEQISSDVLENAVPIMFAQAGLAYGLTGIGGVIFLKIIMFVQVLITISAVVLWFVATINVLFLETEVGIFPEIITKKTKSGKPINAMLFSVGLILIFLIISSSSNASNIYTMLYDMSTIAMVIPFILLLISYIGFKNRNLTGEYQFIKNKMTACIVGGILLFVTLFAFIFGVLDVSLLDHGQITPEFINWFIISFGGVVFFMLIGYGIYISKRKPIMANLIYIIIFLLMGIMISKILLLGLIYFIYNIYRINKKVIEIE